MFRILILLVLGVGVGYMLRGRSFVGVTKWSIQITVCVLLFVFGVSIGSDPVSYTHLTLPTTSRV